MNELFEINIQDYENVTDLLRACVVKLTTLHPKLSVRELAKRAGVSRPFWEKIARGESKSPDYVLAVDIFKLANPGSNIKKFTKKFYPRLFRRMKEARDEEKNSSDDGHEPVESGNAISSPYNYVVATRILSSLNPLTREEVVCEFNVAALDILDELKTCGLVKEENGKIIPIKDTRVQFSSEANHSLMKNVINNNYQPELDGYKMNFGAVLVQGVVLEKAIPIFREELDVAAQRVDKRLNDKPLRGDETMFVVLAADSMKKQMPPQKNTNNTSKKGE